jgi:hypothetical protein
VEAEGSYRQRGRAPDPSCSESPLGLVLLRVVKVAENRYFEEHWIEGNVVKANTAARCEDVRKMLGDRRLRCVALDGSGTVGEASHP